MSVKLKTIKSVGCGGLLLTLLLVWSIVIVLYRILGKTYNWSPSVIGLVGMVVAFFFLSIGLRIFKWWKVKDGEQSLDEVPLKKCPYCAEMIQNDAILCRYCNSSLEPTELTPNLMGEADLKISPNYTEKNRIEITKCPDCEDSLDFYKDSWGDTRCSNCKKVVGR